MHRALEIEDVVCAICKAIVEDHEDSRETLMALALSSKDLFLEPTLDCLWRVIWDLVPLLALFPPFFIEGTTAVRLNFNLVSSY